MRNVILYLLFFLIFSIDVQGEKVVLYSTGFEAEEGFVSSSSSSVSEDKIIGNLPNAWSVRYGYVKSEDAVSGDQSCMLKTDYSNSKYGSLTMNFDVNDPTIIQFNASLDKLFLNTANNYLYIYYSLDKGETWSLLGKTESLYTSKNKYSVSMKPEFGQCRFRLVGVSDGGVGEIFIDDLQIIKERYLPILSFVNDTLFSYVGMTGIENQLKCSDMDISCLNVHYDSSDPTIAKVDESGFVKAYRPGTALITAVTEETDNYIESSASYFLSISMQYELLFKEGFNDSISKFESTDGTFPWVCCNEYKGITPYEGQNYYFSPIDGSRVIQTPFIDLRQYPENKIVFHLASAYVVAGATFRLSYQLQDGSKTMVLNLKNSKKLYWNFNNKKAFSGMYEDSPLLVNNIDTLTSPSVIEIYNLPAQRLRLIITISKKNWAIDDFRVYGKPSQELGSFNNPYEASDLLERVNEGLSLDETKRIYVKGSIAEISSLESSSRSLLRSESLPDTDTLKLQSIVENKVEVCLINQAQKSAWSISSELGSRVLIGGLPIVRDGNIQFDSDSTDIQSVEEPEKPAVIVTPSTVSALNLKQEKNIRLTGYWNYTSTEALQNALYNLNGSMSSGEAQISEAPSLESLDMNTAIFSDPATTLLPFQGASNLTTLQLRFVPWNIAQLKEKVNPNCLIYHDGEDDLFGTFPNLVDMRAQRASKIEICDSLPFNTLFPISADSVIFRKNFQRRSGYDSNEGWESLSLPFTPDIILGSNINGQVKLKPFDALTKKETDGYNPFWLRILDENGFSDCGWPQASTPYIICMPNNPNYPSYYNITGEVKFIAENVMVDSEIVRNLLNVDGCFRNTYKEIESNDSIFVLSDDGRAFIRNSKNAKPFRSFFVIPSSSSESEIRLDDNIFLTDYLPVLSDSTMPISVYKENEVLIIVAPIGSVVDVFGIDGRKLRSIMMDTNIYRLNDLPKGVYIINKQKIML